MGLSEASRRVVERVLLEDWFESAVPRSRAPHGHLLWAEEAIFYGPSGFGTAHGYNEYHEHFIGVLHAGFSSRRFEARRA